MKNIKLYYVIFALAPMMLFTGCGTISGIKSPSGDASVSLSKYNQVCVLDFKTVGTAPHSGAYMGNLFADKIANKIERKNIFQKVSRELSEEESLVISGQITRCTDGNAQLRLWFGMGAGSSYFDADIIFKDGPSGRTLANMDVDKNSWVLGGGIAASQTVEEFMNEAARKVAAQLETVY